MKTVRLLSLIVILVTSAFFSTNQLFGEEMPKDKPNIILIMVDALRPDHLGCYGYSRDTSPNIDKLAQNGVLFTHAYIHAPTTMTSTASVLTSLYPRQHQAWNMHGEEGLKGIDFSLTTLTEVLKANGYKTIGVVANGFLDSVFGFNQGFDEYYETWKLPEAEHSLIGPDAQYFKHLAEAKHTSQIILPWIDKNSQEKFFAFLFYIDPHDPYFPPPPFDEKYQQAYEGPLKGKANALHLTSVNLGKIPLSQDDTNYLISLYDGEISYIDYHIGKLVEELEKNNILDNTIIVFMADHGEEFMDHGGTLHGFAIYNENLRVPLIFSGSKLPKKQSRVTTVVRSIDIMPTILEILGIKIPGRISGRSLVNLWKTEAHQKDRPVFAEMHLNKGGGEKDIYLVSFQKDKWKLIIDKLENRQELYDIENDPFESINLIEDNVAKVKELSTDLEYFLNLQPLVKFKDQVEPAEVDKSTIENLKSLGYLQ